MRGREAHGAERYSRPSDTAIVDPELRMEEKVYCRPDSERNLIHDVQKPAYGASGGSLHAST
jgi:hypothetical protein